MSEESANLFHLLPNDATREQADTLKSLFDRGDVEELVDDECQPVYPGYEAFAAELAAHQKARYAANEERWKRKKIESMRNGSAFAFSTVRYTNEDGYTDVERGERGLNTRAYFAIKFAAALVTDIEYGGHPNAIAIDAVKAADALIEELCK